MRPKSVLQQIKEARKRDYLLVIEAYCNHQGCPSRDVMIRLKDHDDELTALMRNRGLLCPICGRPMACQGIRTFAEQERLDERDARCSVNTQRYIRRHGPFVPLTVMLDDRLPEDAEKRDG